MQRISILAMYNKNPMADRNQLIMDQLNNNTQYLIRELPFRVQVTKQKIGVRLIINILLRLLSRLLQPLGIGKLGTLRRLLLPRTRDIPALNRGLMAIINSLALFNHHGLVAGQQQKPRQHSTSPNHQITLVKMFPNKCHHPQMFHLNPQQTTLLRNQLSLHLPILIPPSIITIPLKDPYNKTANKLSHHTRLPNHRSSITHR